MDKKPKKYVNLGQVILKKKDNPDEPDRYYLKLQQQAKKDGTVIGDQVFPITLANGQVLNSGDILSLFSIKEKMNQLVKDGKIDAEKAEFLSSFLRYDVVMVRDADESQSAPASDEIDF